MFQYYIKNNCRNDRLSANVKLYQEHNVCLANYENKFAVVGTKH